MTFLQSEKDLLSVVIKDPGTTTSNEVQPTNASSIVVTLAGIIIFVKAEQFLNAHDLIDVTFPDSVTLYKLWHPLKILGGSVVTFFGIIISVRLWQPQKA